MNITITPITEEATVSHLAELFGKIEEIYITNNQVSGILFEDGIYFPEDEDAMKIVRLLGELKDEFEWEEECLDSDPDSISAGIYMRDLKESEIANFLDSFAVAV